MASIDELVAKYRPTGGGGAPPAAPQMSADDWVAKYKPQGPIQNPTDKGGRPATKLDPYSRTLGGPGATPDDKALADARRPKDRGGVENTHGNLDEPGRRFLSEATLGVSEAADAASFAVRSQLPRLAGKDPGYGPGRAYDAARQAEDETTAQYKGPGSTAAGVAGGLVGTLAAGGPEAEAMRGMNWAQRAAHGAQAGFRAGTVAGAAGARKHKDIGKEATVGGALGSALGPAAEAGASALKWAGRTANTLSGDRFIPAMKIAEDKLYHALQKDGIVGKAAERVMERWRRAGVDASILDLGGKHTQALVRKAGGVPGQAQHTLQRRAEDVETNLATEATAQVHRLVNDGRPADEILADLKKRRADVADQKYPRQYSSPVTVDEHLAAMFGDRETLGTLRRARGTLALEAAAARGRGDAAQAELLRKRAADIDNLINLGSMSPKERAAHLKAHPQAVQAGTLDRLQTAFKEAGDAAYKNATGSKGRALTGISKVISDRLDAMPELKDARRTYRTYSQMIDGFELGGKLLNAKDASVALKEFRALNKGAKQTARMGLRQQVENELAGNARGTLTKLQSDQVTKAVMVEMFGAEEAARIQRAAKYRLEQLTNVRRAAGAPAQADGSHLGPFTHDPVTAVQRHAIGAVTKASRGLSEKEARGLAALAQRPAARAGKLKPLDDTRSRWGSNLARKGAVRAGKNVRDQSAGGDQ